VLPVEDEDRSAHDHSSSAESKERSKPRHPQAQAPSTATGKTPSDRVQPNAGENKLDEAIAEQLMTAMNELALQQQTANEGRLLVAGEKYRMFRNSSTGLPFFQPHPLGGYYLRGLYRRGGVTIYKLPVAGAERRKKTKITCKNHWLLTVKPFKYFNESTLKLFEAPHCAPLSERSLTSFLFQASQCRERFQDSPRSGPAT
jgi:hypothetical protein